MVMQKSRNIHATWGNDQIRSPGLGEDDYAKQHIVMLSHPGPPVCGLLCFLLLWTEAYLLQFFVVILAGVVNLGLPLLF